MPINGDDAENNQHRSTSEEIIDREIKNNKQAEIEDVAEND